MQEEEFQTECSVVLDPLKDLAGEKFLTPQQNDAAMAAVRNAITRLEPREAQVNALFPQVTDQLKKVNVRQLMDDYRELLSELREALEDWSYEAPGSEEPAAPSGADQAAAIRARHEQKQQDSGIIKILKGLPIIGNILRMLGM